ncbi:MAG: 3-hydroxyacyl-CoA dehydrogenase NAD-binding domain-containing protein [Desulfatibacillaceae bacterium]
MVRRIKKAGVLGSGVMGGGIAALLASVGVETVLLDIVPFDLKDEEKNDPKARNRIVQAGFDGLVKAKPALLMDKKFAKNIKIGNFEDDWNELADCDWIVEVVVENLKIKKDVLSRVDSVRKPTAIVSTNTSGIPLEAMSEHLPSEFRKNFMGTHFFNPVRYMKLLELIPGKETTQEILDFMADFGERILGKGIVWAKDTPNFIGNRIGVQGMVQAMQFMVEDGLTIPEVDALFGPAMGRPKTAMFKTADLVGLDTLGHVANNTYDLVTDDEARESFKLPEFVQKMIDQGLLGKKTPEGGFYKTDLTPEWKKVRKVIDPTTMKYEEYDKVTFPSLEEARKQSELADKMKTLISGDDKGARFVWRVVSNGLIYAANRIPEISDTVVEIDNAMKWGYNFSMGPFESWDAIGVRESVERMEKDGLAVPENVKKMLAGGNETFYKTENGTDYFYDFASGQYKAIVTSPTIIKLDNLKGMGKVVKENESVSLIDLGDGVFCVEFHTKMNAINKQLVETMAEGVEYVEQNGVGVVIGNQAPGFPGAFSAGGDLSYMAGLAKEGKYSDIDEFLKSAQFGLLKARYSPFPVVAAPFGMSLGGGCEVCLGVDRIVGHCELFMGLVEIGVGLLPAGGGCTNLWRRFVESTPESVKLGDLGPFFLQVFQAIAMAKYSNSAEEARKMGFLRPVDRIVMNRDYLIGEAKKEVLRMVDAGYAPPLRKKIRVLGQAAQGMAEAELFNMKSAGYISDHDHMLAARIAYVIGGGDARDNSEISEEAMFALEREAFVDFFKTEKTMARVEHMLTTGKPLRN